MSRDFEDEDVADLSSTIEEKKYRQYLPYDVVRKYLETGQIEPQEWLVRLPDEDKPWTVETRPHHAIEPGTRQVKAADGYFVENAVRLHADWSLAIAVSLEIPSFVWIKSIFPASNSGYQVVTISGADHSERKAFAEQLKNQGAILVIGQKPKARQLQPPQRQR